MALLSQVKKFDSNKLYCSEILSVLLQADVSNQIRVCNIQGTCVCVNVCMCVCIDCMVSITHSKGQVKENGRVDAISYDCGWMDRQTV